MSLQNCKLNGCTLCPRSCGVNRAAGEKGRCGMDHQVLAARAALHMWEEPCISGTKGSGTVFFSGCPLGCIYCQNREIALGKKGIPVTVERLAQIFLDLQGLGAANINLVTGVHFVPQIIKALETAKDRGLVLPVVYNSGGYESLDTLRMLEGRVDIYLPDFKYMDPVLAGRFSHAEDYPEAAKQAVLEMVRQTGPCVFDEEGYLLKGTVVRHLILPGHTRDSRRILTWLSQNLGDSCYVSIMNQYTPVADFPSFPELNRKVTKREYEKVLEHALSLGMTHGFFQDGKTSEESFIPPFDYQGIL